MNTKHTMPQSGLRAPARSCSASPKAELPQSGLTNRGIPTEGEENQLPIGVPSEGG